VKGIGAIGAVVGGLALLDKAATSTDATTKQTIASVLQLGGAIGLAIPGFQAFGAAAIGAGTLLSLFGNEAAEAEKDVKASAVAIYDTLQTLNRSQADVETFTKAQRDASRDIDRIIKTGKTDEQAKIAQTDATNRFVTATLSLASANKAVSDSFDDLLLKLDSIGGSYAEYKNIIGNAARGPNNAVVQRLSAEIATEILRATGTPLYLPEGQRRPIPTGEFKVPPLELSVNAEKILSQHIFDEGGQYGQVRTLTPENIGKLIDVDTGKFNFDVLPSQENLLKLSSVIQQLATDPLDFNQTQIDTLQRTVQDFLVANSTFYAIQTTLLTDQARIQALGSIGALRGEDLKNATLRNQLGIQLQSLLGNADAPRTPQDRAALGPQATYDVRVGIDQEQVRDLIKEITETADGEINIKAFDGDELEKVGETLLRLKEIFPEISAQGEQALQRGIIEMLLEGGVEAQTLEEELGHIPGVLEAISDEAAEAAEELKKAFQGARDEALNSLAQRNAALQAGENSGQYEDNAAGLAALKDQSQQAYDSQIALINAIEGLNSKALPELQAQLANVVGMENATILSSDQLSAAFINNALDAGVSAEGIVKLQGKLLTLIDVMDRISKLRVKFTIKGEVFTDVSQHIAALKIYQKATAAALKNNPFIGPTTGGVTSSAFKELNEAIAELEGLSGELDNLTGGINKTIGSGTGSSFGQLPKSGSGSSAASKASGPDVSTLDLPEEIANAMNRAALIQEAIKRAKELQAKIPGASKEAQNDIVELLHGTQHILEVRGVKDDLLRKALEELAEIERKRLEFETKADTIRRIRVGAGSFAAIANVPVNTKTGVSLGGAEGPINISLNLNGTVLTPAQLAQFADLVASALKRQLAS
jgi:hypothetical protein